MKREKYLQIIKYFGVSIFFLGFGWFLGKKFQNAEIELSKLIFIIIGLILVIIAFMPKK